MEIIVLGLLAGSRENDDANFRKLKKPNVQRIHKVAWRLSLTLRLRVETFATSHAQCKDTGIARVTGQRLQLP